MSDNKFHRTPEIPNGIKGLSHGQTVHSGGHSFGIGTVIVITGRECLVFYTFGYFTFSIVRFPLLESIASRSNFAAIAHRQHTSCSGSETSALALVRDFRPVQLVKSDCIFRHPTARGHHFVAGQAELHQGESLGESVSYNNITYAKQRRPPLYSKAVARRNLISGLGFVFFTTPMLELRDGV